MFSAYINVWFVLDCRINSVSHVFFKNKRWLANQNPPPQRNEHNLVIVYLKSMLPVHCALGKKGIFVLKRADVTITKINSEVVHIVENFYYDLFNCEN